ncbi:hypothetical protein KC19_10G068900 [Ceratodon purpureus]|uniref:Uncharacterized protein n=1 Tax=Ceratodon purpureus TaxID=3225 RepID=A0A8T0GPP4_CERPU|nr:hypothetical protein KC19_10G068900 [Ceratodon purpureus]
MMLSLCMILVLPMLLRHLRASFDICTLFSSLLLGSLLACATWLCRVNVCLSLSVLL